MIEIVCKNGLQEEEKKLCLPKNIRQIGSPRGRHKIYIEDYVDTYLKATAQKKESCAVVFLGKSQVMKEIRYTFVSGAIECGPGVFQWDSICLDENFWNHIENEKQRYFPEKEIVGWFLGKKGQAMELAPVVEAAHRKYFPGRDKILMLMDILEQEEVFFIYDQGYLQKREGYYIYYEKNLPMQEYMVQKKEEETGEQAEENGFMPMRDTGELPLNQAIPEGQGMQDDVGPQPVQDTEEAHRGQEMEESQPEGAPQLEQNAGCQPETASQPEGAMEMQADGVSAKEDRAGATASVQPAEAASNGAAGLNAASRQHGAGNSHETPIADATAVSGRAQVPEKAKMRQQKQKSARKNSGAGISTARKSGAEAKARVKAGTRARIETGEGVKEYLELKKEFQELHKELEKEIPAGSPEKIFAKNNLEEPKTQAEEALESYRHMILERQGRQIARQNRKFLYTASSFFLVAVCVLGITTINNYRKMQEVEDVLHVMSGKTSEGKWPDGEDGPVVESVMSQVEPLEEDGKTPSGALEGQPAADGGSESSQTETGGGPSQPATGSGQETNQAGTGSGEGTGTDQTGAGISGGSEPGQPAAGSGQETDQAGAGTSGGTSQPPAGSGSGTNQTGTGNGEGTSQQAAGSGQGTEQERTAGAQDTEAAGSSQPSGNAGESSTPKDTEETSASQPRYYTVKPGDTLGSICISVYHDQSMMPKVCEANGIENGDKIYVGQKLVLP